LFQTFHELRVRYDQQQDGQAGRAIPAAAAAGGVANNGGGGGAAAAAAAAVDQYRAMAGTMR